MTATSTPSGSSPSASGGPTATPSNKINPIVIKKYANRRLYNTDTSTYVTLEDLCTMIKNGEEVIVFDAKNGDDITRSVLTQIIVEQEAKGGQNLLPTAFLRQLIGFYGNSMQGLVPKYLEHTMQTFAKNQGPMQDYFSKAFGGMFNLGSLEEMGKQNMAMFENAMKMFGPLASQMGEQMAQATQATMGAAQQTTQVVKQASEETHKAAAAAAPEALKPAVEASATQSNEGIKVMQQRLDDLQKQIAALSKKES